jgi:hypothetical protein
MAKETAVVATVALLKVSFGFEGGIFAGTKTAKENAVLFFGQKMTRRSVNLVVSVVLSNFIDVVEIHLLKFAISTVQKNATKRHCLILQFSVRMFSQHPRFIVYTFPFSYRKIRIFIWGDLRSCLII